MIKLDKKTLSVEDLDAVIAANLETSLHIFADAYALAYSRTSVFVIQTEKQTLEISWHQNRLTAHATIGGVVKSFLKNVIFTFSKPVADIKLANRTQTCRTCPLFDAPSTKCRSCGCYMSAKWLYDKSTCPLDKWQ